jgi:hypothetical protein
VNDQLGVQLQLPPRWMAYALDPATAEATIVDEVDRQIAADPDLAVIRHVLIGLLGDKSDEARADEAGFGAVRWEEHPRFGASIASVVGWLVDRQPGRSVEEAIADDLAGLAVQTEIDHFPPHLTRVSLPCGDGVRLEVARSATTDGVQSATVFQTVEYHIPLDDPPASKLFVRFISSNLAYIDVPVAELDAMMHELERTTARFR